MKVAVCHPLAGRGGSEARALWAAEALRDVHDVTLVTAGPIDLSELDAAYGTRLARSGLLVAPGRAPVLLRRLKGGDALRGAWFERHCQDLAAGFDVLLSAYNLIDFGRPAIQCIADFSWDDEIRRTHGRTPTGVRGWFHRSVLLRRGYMALQRRFVRRSGRDLLAGDDLILANSHWTARKLRERWGVTAPVLYPPVSIDPSHSAWADRRPDFLCLGRISPEKRTKDAIEIVAGVRAAGHDVGLRILGDVSVTPYGREIQALCASAGPWASCEGRVDGAKKAALLTTSRYGIHTCQPESFGIAVAEMAKAGCVPFVPAKGGPAEIVGLEELTFTSPGEAVERICVALGNAERMQEVRGILASRIERFTIPRFCADLRTHVQRFAESLQLRSGA